jgi:hypothetical protein
VEEVRLTDPAALLDELLVHDGDLPGGTAEADEAELEPVAEGLGKGVSSWPARLLRLGIAGFGLLGMARADAAPFKPVITRSVAANRIAETPDYAHT